MNAYSVLEHAQLAFNLTPISVRELSIIKCSPCHIYAYIDLSFRPIIKRGTVFTKDILKRHLIEQTPLFVQHQDFPLVLEIVQKKLLNSARSLSIGNPLNNSKKFTNYLSINMEYLYKDPINTETLTIQGQSMVNFAHFLIENTNIHRSIYQEVLKQKFHYTVSQPLLSSILLLSFLKSTHLFSMKDMETLFITSYFKDIGMSLIPREALDSEFLNEREKKLISDHPQNSVKILSGRLPLSANHLKIIEGHHQFSQLNTEISSLRKRGTIQGIESLLINTMDIIAAMITERPYRNSIGIFESLELIRVMIADKYPQEFKQLVSFFHHFFNR